jgi:hypothetical protein
VGGRGRGAPAIGKSGHRTFLGEERRSTKRLTELPK